MLMTKTGRITEGFYAVGHASVPVYLLNGDRPVLFDSGFTGLTEVYLSAIRDILGKRPPAFLFLTHAHWDHVGAAGYFKKMWPELQIVASRKTRGLLLKERVRTAIAALNREALEALKAWGIQSPFSEPFLPFEIDHVLEPPVPFPLTSNQVVFCISSPGHTRDFTVYWIQKPRILIASEAAGCDGVPEFIVDYEAYMEGLDYFLQLRPQVLCTGHQIVVTGTDVPNYLRRLRASAVAYCQFVEASLEKGEPVDVIASRIKAWEWDPKPLPKQPLTAYLINTKRRIETLQERWRKRKES